MTHITDKNKLDETAINLIKGVQAIYGSMVFHNFFWLLSPSVYSIYLFCDGQFKFAWQ